MEVFVVFCLLFFIFFYFCIDFVSDISPENPLEMWTQMKVGLIPPYCALSPIHGNMSAPSFYI